MIIDDGDADIADALEEEDWKMIRESPPKRKRVPDPPVREVTLPPPEPMESMR